MAGRRLALGIIAVLACLLVSSNALADGRRRRAPDDESGVRYGAEVAVAGIYDQDGSAWAGGAAARAGFF